MSKKFINSVTEHKEGVTKLYFSLRCVHCCNFGHCVHSKQIGIHNDEYCCEKKELAMTQTVTEQVQMLFMGG